MYKITIKCQEYWKVRAFQKLLLYFLTTITFFSVSHLSPNNAFAQDNAGKVIGVVIDSETGEGLIGANIYFEGTTLGAASDLDGSFFISPVPPGEYKLIVQMISYATITITDFKVNPGETKKIEVTLKPEALTIEEVVVEARLIENTEASLLKSRQKSIAVSDAISAEAISRSGSDDAAEAMKKVTGASIVGGKYVYVRGLGERYSTTQLNGAELPSSDPDKKAFQLDLLPSNLLENIVTLKTFTPEKPGNFTGGIVDVNTKSFPDNLTMNLSLSSSLNTQANYNNDFLTYQGSDTDWLGFDDGIRDIPAIWVNPSPELQALKSNPRVKARFDPAKAQIVHEAVNSFNTIMDVKQEAVPLNSNFSFSIGNRTEIGKNSSVGYLGSLTYRRSHSFYDNGEIGRYTLNPGATSLKPELTVSDVRGESEAHWGALANIVFNINPSHQLGTNFLYSKSGISLARFQTGKWPHQFGTGEDTPDYFNRVLSFLERNIQSYQLNGQHYFENLIKLTTDWSVTIAKTNQDEPDRRMLASLTFSNPDTNHIIKGSNWDQPSRYYRFLEDNKNTYNLNFTVPFSQWSGLSSKFKFGASYQTIDRNFQERIFTYDVQTGLFNQVNGEVSGLFAEENNGIIRIDTLSGERLRYEFGNLISENSRDKNNYTGQQDIQAIYAMLELPLFRRLRFIGGLRYETTELEVESQDQSQPKGNVNEGDFLPSVNFIYLLRDNMNLRAAVTRTLARPTFRELAPYSTKEFVNDWELVGNPGLKRTLIDNYDLRWEWFTRPGEILAISAFYKNLRNPIELAIAPESISANLIVQYNNVEKARILGTEIEARIGLDHFSSTLQNLSIGTNLSLIKSTVDIEARELRERREVDPDYPDTRNLQGQSDYIFNLDLTYRNNIGTVASVYFNTFGERLSKVSAIITPDIFEQPANQLDLLFSQQFLGRYFLKFSVKNILNSSYKELYKFKGDEFIAQSYSRGITYGIGLEYRY